MNPEINAMSAVATALADLDEEQQGRVLRWAAERYGVTLGKGRARHGDAADDDADQDVTDEEMTSEDPEFADFGDLFAAADPRNQ